MLRRVAIVAALALAIVMPPGIAMAAPATGSAATGSPAATGSAATTGSHATTGSRATTASVSTQSFWRIEGTYSTYWECDDRGYFGQLNGWWLSYYCEYDSFYDNYRLWVEYPGNPRICQTDAHVYVVLNRVPYFSGYEGTESLGVPTMYVSYGTRVTLGGNGIKPGTTVSFKFYDANTLAQVGSGTSRTAGSNCVANENGYTINFASGRYLARATYTSGNSGNTYTEHRVTFIEVF